MTTVLQTRRRTDSSYLTGDKLSLIHNDRFWGTYLSVRKNVHRIEGLKRGIKVQMQTNYKIGSQKQTKKKTVTTNQPEPQQKLNNKNIQTHAHVFDLC